MNRQDGRSELQERISSELQEKAKKNALNEAKPIDGVEDVGYLDNTKSTTSLASVWLFLFVAAVIIVAIILLNG